MTTDTYVRSQSGILKDPVCVRCVSDPDGEFSLVKKCPKCRHMNSVQTGKIKVTCATLP